MIDSKIQFQTLQIAIETAKAMRYAAEKLC